MSKQIPMPMLHFAKEISKGEVRDYAVSHLEVCAYICILYASIITDHKLHNQSKTITFILPHLYCFLQVT